MAFLAVDPGGFEVLWVQTPLFRYNKRGWSSSNSRGLANRAIKYQRAG